VPAHDSVALARNSGELDEILGGRPFTPDYEVRVKVTNSPGNEYSATGAIEDQSSFYSLPSFRADEASSPTTTEPQ
jgi:hypothetical protein